MQSELLGSRYEWKAKLVDIPFDMLDDVVNLPLRYLEKRRCKRTESLIQRKRNGRGWGMDDDELQ